MSIKQSPVYKEVKNLVHNEMGITKEDILKVIEGVAREEVKKVLNENNLGGFVDMAIRNAIHLSYGWFPHGHASSHNIDKFKRHVESTLVNEVGQFVIGKLNINLSLSNQETGAV